MPGLDPGIHSEALDYIATAAEWIAGSSPAMTTELCRGLYSGSGPFSFSTRPAR